MPSLRVSTLGGSQSARLLALVAALFLFAAPVLAVDPPRLSGTITDLSEVLGDRSAIVEAQTKLYNETGTQLYVLYLPTLDGENILDFADRVSERNAGRYQPAGRLAHRRDRRPRGRPCDR